MTPNIRRHNTIPQELEDLDDLRVNPDSFEDDDDDDEFGLLEQQQPTSTPLHHLVPQEIRNLMAGGMAGMVAKTVVAPLDRIKILYQVSDIPYSMKAIPNVARNIMANEGILALWKGHTATMLRVFPYSGIQFMVYDRIKHSLATDTGLSALESLGAGMTAGCVSVMCTYPLDLTRAQLAVLRKHRHHANNGIAGVLKNNFTEGGVPGLFRGMTPTLLGILPYAGIAFCLNEQGKREVCIVIILFVIDCH